MYFGKVINVNDKLKLGRVKVRVFDLHDNIKEEDIKDEHEPFNLFQLSRWLMGNVHKIERNGDESIVEGYTWSRPGILIQWRCWYQSKR